MLYKNSFNSYFRPIQNCRIRPKVRSSVEENRKYLINPMFYQIIKNLIYRVFFVICLISSVHEKSLLKFLFLCVQIEHGFFVVFAIKNEYNREMHTDVCTFLSFLSPPVSDFWFVGDKIPDRLAFYTNTAFKSSKTIYAT